MLPRTHVLAIYRMMETWSEQQFKEALRLMIGKYLESEDRQRTQMLLDEVFADDEDDPEFEETDTQEGTQVDEAESESGSYADDYDSEDWFWPAGGRDPDDRFMTSYFPTPDELDERSIDIQHSIHDGWQNHDHTQRRDELDRVSLKAPIIRASVSLNALNTE